MTAAADLRAEALRLRAFALIVTDPEALMEIRMMIAELERRSRELGNGDGGGETSMPASEQRDLPSLRYLRHIGKLPGLHEALSD
jgi:hypothetical protein